MNFWGWSMLVEGWGRLAKIGYMDSGVPLK